LTVDRFGNANQAYLFDGDDDKITLGDESFAFETNDFSYSLWIRSDSTQFSGVFTKGVALNGSYGIFTGNPDGFLAIDSVGFLHAESNSDFRTGNALLTNGVWHHIVVSHSYSDSTSIFVDNQLIASDSMPFYDYTGFNSYGHDLTLGSAGIMGLYFKGAIDDVRIYERFLTATDIDSVYNLPNPGPVNIITPESGLASIKLFPNPTSQNLNIVSKSIIYVVKVYAMDGTTTLEVIAKSDKLTIPTNTIAPGIYVVEISNKQGVYKELFVKQ
jgi:hypothetical protein